MLEFKEFKKNVIGWADDKNLLKRSNLYPQYAKVLEETQEILVALNKMERAISEEEFKEGEAMLKDAIGDTNVTLEILSAQASLDSDECRALAWNEIKNRKGKTVGGTFVKEVL